MAGMRSLLLKTAGVMLALTTTVAAQEYPTKPVRIIVPFPPGGINDVVARVIATQLSGRLGKQFIVDNRSGAGGVAGTELAANAPKDGYTLLIVSLAHTVNPWLYKLPYDPIKSFAPVAILASSPNMLAVHPELPVKSVKEFIAYAKEKPGQLQYASGGVGGSLHLGAELFRLTAGIDIMHVPFRGGGPAVIDVVGGHAKMIIATVTTTAPHIRSGKLRALGVSGTKRSPLFPEVPTIAEAGLPGYEAGNWIGIVAPAGTPADIVAKLHGEISAVQDSPEMQKQLAADGAETVRMSSAEFGAFMVKEMGKWERVVREAAIKAE
jgi:tripartite-type tricarboxylate transporter receptor subunit TctC